MENGVLNVEACGVNLSEAREIPVLAVIPARYASTRFPGKPLAMIQGKPMIQHVWERVCRVPEIARVVVATDDERIRQAAEQFGAEVRMTDAALPSGTDRAWAVAAELPEYPWVLNVQGDEPFVNPQHLSAAIMGLQACPLADLMTLVTPLRELSAWHDPNLVKAVLSAEGRALYFSRAPIPYHRDKPEVPEQVYRHVGLYLYRRTVLEQFTELPVSPLEQLEKLEQLRAFEAGFHLYAQIISQAPIGVDTPEDLIRLLDSSR